jgi:uncharacterized membrane protein
MSELVAVAYPDVYRAGEVCAVLQRLQKEFLIEMEDAAYVTREANGKVKLHQTMPIVGTAASIGLTRGTIWGGLVGLLFLQPILGLAVGGAVGAASGVLTGKLADFGIPDPFMKELGEKLQPGTSALFVLFRKATWEKVLPHAAQFGGTVIHSSLSPEAEAKLQAALTEGAEPRMAA